MKLNIEHSPSPLVAIPIRRITWYAAVLGDSIINYDNDPDRCLRDAIESLIYDNDDSGEFTRQTINQIDVFPATERVLELLPEQNWDLREDGVLDIDTSET